MNRKESPCLLCSVDVRNDCIQKIMEVFKPARKDQILELKYKYEEAYS